MNEKGEGRLHILVLCRMCMCLLTICVSFSVALGVDVLDRVRMLPKEPRKQFGATVEMRNRREVTKCS